MTQGLTGIAALEAEMRDRLADLQAEAGYMASIKDVQEATITRLTAERDALVKALEPFAAMLDTHTNGYEDSADDDVVRSVGTLGRDYQFITVGDLRRARAALASLRPTDCGGKK